MVLWHRGKMRSKLFWIRTIIFYAFWKFKKHYLIFFWFLSTKNFEITCSQKSQTYSNCVACTEKKTLATFIVRGNQVWVEACFCLIASIRLVDGKKPQDAKIVKSEEAPTYMEKRFYRLFSIRPTHSFFN